MSTPRVVPPVTVDHPAWSAAAATGLAYLVAIGGLFVLLFAVPYLLVSAA